MKLVVFFYCGCSELLATSLLENGNMIIASCTCFGLSMEFIQFIVFFGFKRQSADTWADPDPSTSYPISRKVRQNLKLVAACAHVRS